jgi:hypothetical protein
MRSVPSIGSRSRPDRGWSRADGGDGTDGRSSGWEERQRAVRDRCWPDVERLLSGLPDPLFRQAKLLEYDLALRHATTGQVRDAFVGPDRFPLWSIATWLLDDLGVPDGALRETTERHLFRAGVVLALRVQATEDATRRDTFDRGSQAAVIPALSELAVAELARVVPVGSDRWARLAAASLAGLAASMPEASDVSPPGRAPAEPDTWLRPRLAAAAEILAVAACAVALADDRATDRVVELVTDLAVAHEALDDLADVARDLDRRRPTYPIVLAARRAGLPLDPWPSTRVGLGAVVATGTVAEVGDLVLRRFASARRAAAELELSTFAAFLAQAAGDAADRVRAGAADGAAGEATPRRRPLLRIAEPTLPLALRMAEAFLDADPALEESWEVHREGMFAAPLVVSRFPAGLVLEILRRHGRSSAEAVDAFVSFTITNRFRYYDHPWSDGDSDTIGVAARLAASSPAEGADRSGRLGYPEITAALDCVAADVDRTGAIPVWVPGCPGVVGAEGPRPTVTALGEDCGTVAANLLLGLVAWDPVRYRRTIELGGARLVSRILESGLGANVDYPRLYAVGAFARVLDALERLEVATPTAGSIADARAELTGELARLVSLRAPRRGPQDAALLALACLEMDRPDLLPRDWTWWVLGHQRFDGGWDAQPFAAAPNRGGSVTWYASATLTTALCYDALARWAASSAEGEVRA